MRLIAPIVFLILLGLLSKPVVKVEEKRKKPKSCGYVVVTYGVGVDCNGDTITLRKTIHGYERIN